MRDSCIDERKKLFLTLGNIEHYGRCHVIYLNYFLSFCLTQVILHFYLYIFVLFYFLFFAFLLIFLLFFLFLHYFVNIFWLYKTLTMIYNFQQRKQLLILLLYKIYVFIFLFICRIILKHKNFSLEDLRFKLYLLNFILFFNINLRLN